MIPFLCFGLFPFRGGLSQSTSYVQLSHSLHALLSHQLTLCSSCTAKSSLLFLQASCLPLPTLAFFYPDIHRPSSGHVQTTSVWPLCLPKIPNKGCLSDGLIPEQKPNIPISDTCNSVSSLYWKYVGIFTSCAISMFCRANRPDPSAGLVAPDFKEELIQSTSE